MKKILVSTTFFLIIFIVSTILPSSLHAQSTSRRSSAYSSKIRKLDDDKVQKLPVPILFGVKLGSITPNFGDERGGGTRTHEGLDIMALKGAPIISPTKAVVTRTGSGSNSGKYVNTANPGGETFVYMHLSEILVKSGDELDVGELIGYVGNTGNASGGPAHLHFEVRDGRKATDPYPRISREFTLEEKIEFLEDALPNADDEDDFIEFIVKNYALELRQAQALAIKLPSNILKKLEAAPLPIYGGTVSGLTPGDLALNSEGPLVIELQKFLIKKNIGPAARALLAAGATGYFGPITERALIEYQVANGISPAVGYYGPKTRAHMLASE